MSSQAPRPQTLGRFEVLEELGSGAMGVVYLCVDPRLARPVAIKVLKESETMTPAERDQYAARFRREAEAAGRMTHPDIVQVYDVGPSYMVMEFVEGQTLQALLRAGAVFSVRGVLDLVIRVADALDYAHRCGIVHRDIKPANIMLTADGAVKVMDFGVARLASSTLTVAGTVLGSVRYMAPEQMMGEAVDGRADVFSLAAVAYELLTGQPPYPGRTITEVVTRVVHGDHVPPRQADNRLPDQLNPIFARAFAPRVADRYQTATSFTRDVEQAAGPVLDMDVVHPSPSGNPGRVNVQSPTVKLSASPRPLPPPATASSSSATVELSAPGTRAGGVIALDADSPGARVFFDDRAAGEVPCSGIEAAFGRHTVRFERTGRETLSVEVQLSREKPLQAISVSLPLPRDASEPIHAGQLVPFGPEVEPPRRIAGTLPAYPEAARERGIEGGPVVEVWVSETGEVIDVAIVESAGALLDGALLQAVAAWRFTPPMVKGVPVSLRMTVQHHFRR